jgi:hypothetical protein
MAPQDEFRLPLRWQFIPAEEGRHQAIRWRWRPYSTTGAMAMESQDSFDSLTECMHDARRHGYNLTKR